MAAKVLLSKRRLTFVVYCLRVILIANTFLVGILAASETPGNWRLGTAFGRFLCESGGAGGGNDGIVDRIKSIALGFGVGYYLSSSINVCWLNEVKM